MRSERRLPNRFAAGWLIAAFLGALPFAGGLISPESIKAAAALVGALAWPAAFLVALWWFKPEISRVVDRLTELSAFGVNAKLNTLETALSKSAQEAKETGGLAKAPTEKQVERASELKEAIGESIDLIRKQVSDLADDYQNVRASLPSGPERTGKMEVIVAKMRAIGLAAYPLRWELSASPSPGYRLQAIACLQLKTDFDMLDWLADRVGSEKPFVSYHALVALNVAASSPMAKLHSTALNAAFLRAEEAQSHFGSDTDRGKMLDELRRRLRLI